MKIFFAGSIRGGRELQPTYENCLKLLEKYGEVLNKQIGKSDLPAEGEIEMNEKLIYQKEVKVLEESDIVIADVTIPSLGVGYLIRTAENLNKKVIAVYFGNPIYKLSAMIQGNENIKLYQYKNLEELETIFENIF